MRIRYESIREDKLKTGAGGETRMKGSNAENAENFDKKQKGVGDFEE